MSATTAAPEEWEEADPNFAAWRRLGTLVGGAPAWERWWGKTLLKPRRVIAALTLLARLDEDGWRALEGEAARGGGGAGRSSPCTVAKRWLAGRPAAEDEEEEEGVDEGGEEEEAEEE
jgi:hypothetical protein